MSSGSDTDSKEDGPELGEHSSSHSWLVSDSEYSGRSDLDYYYDSMNEDSSHSYSSKDYEYAQNQSEELKMVPETKVYIYENESMGRDFVNNVLDSCMEMPLLIGNPLLKHKVIKYYYAREHWLWNIFEMDLDIIRDFFKNFDDKYPYQNTTSILDKCRTSALKLFVLLNISIQAHPESLVYLSTKYSYYSRLIKSISVNCYIIPYIPLYYKDYYKAAIIYVDNNYVKFSDIPLFVPNYAKIFASLEPNHYVYATAPEFLWKDKKLLIEIAEICDLDLDALSKTKTKYFDTIEYIILSTHLTKKNYEYLMKKINQCTNHSVNFYKYFRLLLPYAIADPKLLDYESFNDEFYLSILRSLKCQDSLSVAHLIPKRIKPKEYYSFVKYLVEKDFKNFQLIDFAFLTPEQSIEILSGIISENPHYLNNWKCRLLSEEVYNKLSLHLITEISTKFYENLGVDKLSSSVYGEIALYVCRINNSYINKYNHLKPPNYSMICVELIKNGFLEIENTSTSLSRRLIDINPDFFTKIKCNRKDYLELARRAIKIKPSLISCMHKTQTNEIAWIAVKKDYENIMYVYSKLSKYRKMCLWVLDQNITDYNKIIKSMNMKSWSTETIQKISNLYITRSDILDINIFRFLYNRQTLSIDLSKIAVEKNPSLIRIINKQDREIVKKLITDKEKLKLMNIKHSISSLPSHEIVELSKNNPYLISHIKKNNDIYDNVLKLCIKTDPTIISKINYFNDDYYEICMITLKNNEDSFNFIRPESPYYLILMFNSFSIIKQKNRDNKETYYNDKYKEKERFLRDILTKEKIFHCTPYYKLSLRVVINSTYLRRILTSIIFSIKSKLKMFIPINCLECIYDHLCIGDFTESLILK